MPAMKSQASGCELRANIPSTSTGCGRKNSPIWEGHSFGWGARPRTAVYVPFSVYTMARSGEHRAFIVEEFIKNGGSLVATQRAFRIRFAPGRRDTVPDKIFFLFSGATSKQRFTNNVPKL